MTTTTVAILAFLFCFLFTSVITLMYQNRWQYRINQDVHKRLKILERQAAGLDNDIH